MQEKYLPIGTVCKLRGKDKKLMVISFLPKEYEGKLNTYDYLGCAYPEGFLTPQSLSAFNHEEIEKVEFIGYVSEEHNKLNNELKQANVEVVRQESPATESPYVFDANGVVIADNTVNETVPEKTPTVIRDNPFEVGYQAPPNSNNNIVTNRFVFDENGIIIEDNSEKMQETQEPTGKTFTAGNFVFDENGFVIADNSVSEPQQEPEQLTPEPQQSPYVFDENGVVIEDNSAKQSSSSPEELELLN